MTKYPMWLLIGAAVLGVLVALVLVIPQAPVSEKQGTAPSVLDTQLAERGCANVPEPDRQRCLQEAQARAARTGPAADQASTSSNTSRAARGSGVEGMTSGGTTTSGGGAAAPADGR